MDNKQPKLVWRDVKAAQLDIPKKPTLTDLVNMPPKASETEVEKALENIDLQAIYDQALINLKKKAQTVLANLESYTLNREIQADLQAVLSPNNFLNLPEPNKRLVSSIANRTDLEFLETQIWLSSLGNAQDLNPLNGIARDAYNLSFAVNGAAANFQVSSLIKSNYEIPGFTTGGLLSHFTQGLDSHKSFKDWLTKIQANSPESLLANIYDNPLAQMYLNKLNKPGSSSMDSRDIFDNLKRFEGQRAGFLPEIGRLIKILQLYPELYEGNIGETSLALFRQLWYHCSQNLYNSNKLSSVNTGLWTDENLKSLVKLLNFRNDQRFQILFDSYSPTTTIIARDSRWIDRAKFKITN